MLARKDFRQPLYYENGNPLTGSDGKLRFCIAPIKEDTDGKPIKKPVDLLVTAWPGPYCMEATADELKLRQSFALSEDGLQEIVTWLNSVEV